MWGCGGLCGGRAGRPWLEACAGGVPPLPPPLRAAAPSPPLPHTQIRAVALTLYTPPCCCWTLTPLPSHTLPLTHSQIRAFALTQYAALLLLDADTVVLRDLSPLWALPAPFAAVWDQSKWLSRHRTKVCVGVCGVGWWGGGVLCRFAR